jgi:ATP-binding cassette subfamily F protein 3
MEELTDRKNEIEVLLSDGTIYDAENKDKLNSLTIELHSINSNLEEIEIEWLEYSDELQNLIDEFNKQNN